METSEMNDLPSCDSGVTILQCLVTPPANLPRRKSAFRRSVLCPQVPIVAIFTGTLEERSKKEKAFTEEMDKKFESQGALAQWFSYATSFDPDITRAGYADWLTKELIQGALIQEK